MVMIHDHKHLMVAWELGASSITAAPNHICVFTGAIVVGGNYWRPK